MKTVYIIDEYVSSKTNGIGTYIGALTHCLKDSGINVCLVSCSHDTHRFRIELKDGVKHMQFPTISGFFGQYYQVIDKFLRLYITDSPENTFLFNHTPCEFLVKTVKSSFPQSKAVFVIHDMVWTGQMQGDKNVFKKFVSESSHSALPPSFKEEKRMFEAVDNIIALAGETVDLLESVYNVCNSKIRLIHNGLLDTHLHLDEFSRSQLKNKLFIPENEKVILFVGRVKQVKGIYQIINALKTVVKTRSDFRLVVAGTLFEAKNVTSQLCEIASKITFTGQISKEELSQWYQIADIGLLASYWEQCSYTGIEMMMHGLPIVASDGFCLGDMFIDNENAKVAKIGDRRHPEEFENNLSIALLELLDSEELRREIGKKGRAAYESKYQIDFMKKDYEEFFKF